MRTIAALIGLIFVATIIVAQDAVQPSTHLVNPICDWAFSRAVDGAQASPAAPTIAVSPDQRASPDPSVSPEPRHFGSYLDEAVRICASVEDFEGAAALHPEVLGDADPLLFLMDRCTDPTAGLEGYATCGSLKRTLATPAPTPSPTLTVAPTPRPTKRPKAETKPRPTPVTETLPVRPPARSAPPALVALPKRMTFKFPGATQVRYFSVSGRSMAVLTARTKKAAKRFCGKGTLYRPWACVHPSTDFDWDYKIDRGTGACTITRWSTRLRTTVYFPRWTKPSRVPPVVLDWWRTAMRGLAKHESVHVRIFKNYATRLSGQLVGKPCGSAQRIVDRWAKQMEGAQNTFDRREYCATRSCR